MSSQQAPKSPITAKNVGPHALPETSAEPSIPATPSPPQSKNNNSIDLLANMDFEGVIPVKLPQANSQNNNNITLSQIMANVAHVKAMIKLTDESQKTIAEKDRLIESLTEQATKQREHANNATQAAIVFGNEIKVKSQKIEEKEQEIKNIKVQLENVNTQLETVNKQLATAKKSEPGRTALLKQYEAKVQDMESKYADAQKELTTIKSNRKLAESNQGDSKKRLMEEEKKYKRLEAEHKALEEEYKKLEEKHEKAVEENNELEDKYQEVCAENVDLQFDSEAENAIKREIQELKQQLHHSQNQNKHFEETIQKKTTAEKARANELNSIKEINIKQQEDHNMLMKDYEAVKKDLATAKKQIDQFNKSKSTASGSSSPTNIQSALPLTTEKKLLKRLRTWKVQIDRLKSENKYYKARNTQLSQQIANFQSLDALLASSSSEHEDDESFSVDFDIDLQEMMVQQDIHPLSTPSSPINAILSSPTQMSLPAPVFSNPSKPAANAILSSSPKQAGNASPSPHSKSPAENTSLSPQSNNPQKLTLPRLPSPQKTPTSPPSALLERRRSSSSSSNSSQSSAPKSPNIFISPDIVRKSLPKPSMASAPTSPPKPSTITTTEVEEFTETNHVPRTSSGLIPPPSNISTSSTSRQKSKRVHLSGVKHGSALDRFVNSSNPAKLLKNNKSLVLNTQSSASVSPAPASPVPITSPKMSTQSSPVLMPSSPLKRTFSVASSTDEISDPTKAVLPLPVVTTNKSASSSPAAATTTIATISSDTIASKKQRVETEFIKSIDGYIKSITLPTDITIEKLKICIKEVIITYQQMKTSLDPEVKRMSKFGIKGQYEINAPGVWDKREKAFAWYLSYAASLDPSHFEYVMKQLLDKINHDINLKHLDGCNVRLVRLVTLICKSNNKLDILKALIYDIVRWSGDKSNIMYCLLNIGNAWKEALVPDQNPVSVTKAVQVCVSFMGQQEDANDTIKSLYQKLASLVEWPIVEANVNEFINTTYDHLNALTDITEAKKDELVKIFVLAFATMNDWKQTYSEFILKKLWPLMSVDNFDEFALDVIGALAILGKSLDSSTPDKPGVKYIRALMNNSLSIEDPEEGVSRLQAIAKKYSNL